MQKQTCYIWQPVPPDLPDGMYTLKIRDTSTEEISISHIERFYGNWMFDDNGYGDSDNFEVIAYQEETEAYILTEEELVVLLGDAWNGGIMQKQGSGYSFGDFTKEICV